MKHISEVVTKEMLTRRVSPVHAIKPGLRHKRGKAAFMIRMRSRKKFFWPDCSCGSSSPGFNMYRQAQALMHTIHLERGSCVEPQDVTGRAGGQQGALGHCTRIEACFASGSPEGRSYTPQGLKLMPNLRVCQCCQDTALEASAARY